MSLVVICLKCCDYSAFIWPDGIPSALSAANEFISALSLYVGVCVPCVPLRADKNNSLENSPFPWWITLNWVETRMERGWRKSWREWEREKVCFGLKCSYRVGIKKKQPSTIFNRSLTRGDVHHHATSASLALRWGTSQNSPNPPITCPESLWLCRSLPALSGHG